MSDEFGFSLGFFPDILRSQSSPRCFDVLGWGLSPKVRMDGQGPWAVFLPLLAFVLSVPGGQTQTHASFPSLTLPGLCSTPTSQYLFALGIPHDHQENVRVSSIQFYRRSPRACL